MKKFNTIYYLLFVLLIFGSFASMAQNDYGVKILGYVSIAFTVLFSIHLISFINKDSAKQEKSNGLELISLIVLSAILALRVFYIRFPFVELLFGAAGLLLILVYVNKLVRHYKLNKVKSNLIAGLVVLFHASIIFYVGSMVLAAFIPSLSEPAGGVAFALLIAFVILGIINKEIMLGSEKVSAFSMVTRFKDRSVVLITLFILFTAYMGLTKIGALPKMYSDEFPQAYFNLVNMAETGKEEALNGKYKHEEFKEKYDRFVERNANADKK